MRYLIRVDGAWPAQALDAFPALKASPQRHETLLHGDLPDQAALAGVLDFLSRRRVEIVEIIAVPSAATPPHANALDES